MLSFMQCLGMLLVNTALYENFVLVSVNVLDSIYNTAFLLLLVQDITLKLYTKRFSNDVCYRNVKTEPK